jgi:hypothetical protein
LALWARPHVESLENRCLLSAGTQALLSSFGQIPLSFEANQGQTDAQVQFLSRGSGYALFLTPSEAVLRLHRNSGKVETASDTMPDVVRMQFIGGNPAPAVAGLDELPGKSNYFLGNDPSQWRTNVANYGKVAFQDLYPGIDLVYYGQQRQLEYDFVVAPGANPASIHLTFAGATTSELDAAGNLVLHTAGGDVIEQAPVMYQEIGGARQNVYGGYVVGENGEVSFTVGAYNPGLPLVIDPILSYSTYLGGSGAGGAGNDIAVDALGNAYVIGSTNSTNFPTVSPLQLANAGDLDVFVAKLNAAGSALVYSTYLGGSSDDQGTGITLDSQGNAYITGATYSTNFPTVSPLQPKKGGDWDAFVAKLNAAGTALVYSTYLGGSGKEIYLHSATRAAIAVDALGDAYVTGSTNSTDFPTANAFQPVFGGGFDGDAFVAKLNAAGTALVYSTYLGGSADDVGTGIAVDTLGNAYVTGTTASTNFPTANAVQPANAGSQDAFVAKLSPSGTVLYSTYLGGSGAESADHSYMGLTAIAVDALGNAYVTGSTESTDFPTANALQPANAGKDAFVAKLNSAGTALVYSTYLGGNGVEQANGIVVDALGNAYVIGATSSTDFPMASRLQPANGGGYEDAFVAKLNAGGTALVFSTYLGGSDFDAGTGIAVDALGNAYVTGITISTDFPTANPLQAAGGGGFVAKIAVDPLSLYSCPIQATATVPFTGVVAFVVDNRHPAAAGDFTAIVNWGDGSTSTGSLVPYSGGLNVLASHTYAHEGVFSVTVSALNSDGLTATTTPDVATVADAPLIAHGRDIFCTAGTPVTQVVGSFEDLDPNGFAGEYETLIDWGDGSPFTPGTISASGTGFDAAGDHTYATPGNYPITVRIFSAGNLLVTIQSTAHVDPAVPLFAINQTFQATAAVPFTTVVGFVSDPTGSSSADDFTAVVEWGDGSSSTGSVVPGGTSFVILASHTFAHAGTFSVGIVILHRDGRTVGSPPNLVTVAYSPLTPHGHPVFYAPATLTTQVVGSFEDLDPNAFPGEYDALIDWGDGTPNTPGTISASGAGFDVTGTHTYAAAGNYPIAARIFSNSNLRVTIQSLALVNPPTALSAFGRPLQATAAVPFTDVVAFVVDPGGTSSPEDFTALVDWGDGSRSSGSVVARGAGFDVQASHTYAQEGTFLVTVNILHRDGRTIATPPTPATVADAPLTPSGRLSEFTEAQTATLVVGSFADLDPSGFPGEYQATITWGDGTQQTPGMISASGAAFDVTGTHAYATSGSYPIMVNVQALHGAMTVILSQALVRPPDLLGQPLGLSVTGNKKFTGAVAGFTDPDPRHDFSHYQATITWPDDNTTSTGQISGNNPFTVRGSHTFSKFLGTLTLKVVVQDLDTPGRTVTILSRVADPSAPQAHQLYVGQLYQDLLGRTVDDRGLAFWAGQLDQGVPRAQVVQGLMTSPEYHLQEVRQAYHTLLFREPDPQGLSYFATLLDSGATLEQVQALLAGSAEYSQTRGGGTQEGFLNALFADALGRRVDASGQLYFEQALAAGVSPAQVAEAVFGSEEYRRVLVDRLFEQYLLRPADTGGLEWFTAALRSGARDQDVVGDLLVSDEYLVFAPLGSL